MHAMKLFIATAMTTICLSAWADCTQECEDAYEACKAATDSPNGVKICGSDYHKCKTDCAGNGE